jgi:16S rRNA (adenine1518-N6/adenine1519-N6)-dimethyltransferase
VGEPSKELLKERGLRPKKSFGQNFLLDERHLDAIVAQIRAVHAPGRRVVELGGGAGALTARIAELGPVTVIERDRDLVPVLRERFEDKDVTVVEANAATAPYEAEDPFVLVGNLPYHMTSQLLFRARDEAARLAGVFFLIQKEVADRVAADPGNKKYGVLSVLLQECFEAETVHVVPKGAFWPVPDVDGAVVRLVPRAQRLGEGVDLDRFAAIVKAGFEQRRKTLRNTVGKKFPGALEAAGIDEKARPETLSVEDFVALARAVVDDA